MVMPKMSTVYRCQQCDATAPKWAGQCQNCKAWNTMVEEVQMVSKKGGGQRDGRVRTGTGSGGSRSVRMMEVANAEKAVWRALTGSVEFDRVLGGGIVPGSVVLIAGEPGIGKSTLLTQLAVKSAGQVIDSKPGPVLYVCGEESVEQVRMRVDRISNNVDTSMNVAINEHLYFLPEMNVDEIISEAQAIKPALMIVDSIQTLRTDDLEGMAGSVGQVRESALRLTEMAKREGIAIFIVGHVTKEGTIAGPKVLEHMVDVVLSLWGDEDRQWRFLKTQKNRFGTTDEVGVFEMDEAGMQDVANPSGVFLEDIQDGVPGSVIVALMEGTRPILVEVQALVVDSQLAVPRRVVNGIPLAKLQVLTAVLQKRCGLAIGNRDVFVNVAGGLRIDEPAADLGIALAIASSFKNVALPKGSVAIGEVGLLGDVRKVSNLKRRIDESKRLGYTKVISPNEHNSLRAAVSQILGKKQ
jgi:DNA repair protein RadA/Sms